MKAEIRKENTRKGEATLVTLTNASGASVTLCSVGAAIVAVNVPDAAGNMADVVIGYKEADSYFYDGPCSGKVPGRYANRIAAGKLTVDGKQYQLVINNGPNALHGGPEGFQNQIWDTEVKGDDTVVFTYHSADGEENYPGNLTAKAVYKWNDACELSLDLYAETDAPTVVNLTNHVYFNLAGEASGSALGQELVLKASKYLPTDSTLIPTGEIADVAGTPMDFTTPHVIGERINDDFAALVYGKGYDNCWVIDDYEPRKEQLVACLTDKTSGRKLEVITDQPAVQVYTGNYLGGDTPGKSGRPYNDYEGVAIECQDMPDAPNHPTFPSTGLLPGEEYHRVIKFKFTNI